MALSLVPQSTDTLASTQQPILQNFTTINAAFLVDHVEYALANQGKHNQITFPIHTGTIPANGAPDANEIYLVNQNAAPTNIPDIWMQRGAGTPFPITGSEESSPGWSYLPSGILLKWGQVNSGSSGTFTHNAAQGPSYEAVNGSVYIVLLTPNSGAGVIFSNLNVSAFGNGAMPNQFTYVMQTNFGPGQFSYLMIGNS